MHSVQKESSPFTEIRWFKKRGEKKFAVILIAS
jgi:hypothetical protein